MRIVVFFLYMKGTTTWLFLDNTFYIETIGFLAVFFEALLGTPQFLRNFRLKSTEGMSVKMVSLFLKSIRSFFIFYFINRFLCGHLVIYLKLYILFFEMLQCNFGFVVYYKLVLILLYFVKFYFIQIKIDHENHSKNKLHYKKKNFIPFSPFVLFLCKEKNTHLNHHKKISENFLSFKIVILKMNRTIIVSSPGKLILGGEHAVVYGRRALVTSIGMRLYMKLTEENDQDSNRKFINVIFHDTNQQYSIDLLNLNESNPIEIQAIIFVYNHFQLTNEINLEIRSHIPIGAGLGSSAAFSVCLVGCFYILKFKTINQNEINQLAYQVECLFHGTPSGVDNTISTYGQSLIYSRTLKKHIDFRLSNLVIIDTGIPKSTKRMVELVRTFIENNPKQGEEILNQIERCVDQMIEYPEQIHKFFQQNQQLLKTLGISLNEIDNIIDKLAENNISTKITGAGGGGCLIALNSNLTKDQILDLLKENSIKSIQFVECGVEGLREEQTFPTN